MGHSSNDGSTVDKVARPAIERRPRSRAPGLAAQLAAASRALHREPTTQATVTRCVQIATELIPHCDYAGVSLVHEDGTIDSPAATNPLVIRNDELQYQLDEGPCIDAVRRDEIVSSPDLAEEHRWPNWAPRASTELNVASVLCLRLFTSTTVVGTLNLYSTRAHAFDRSDINAATILAADIAVAVAETQFADDLRLSAHERNLIGQAAGILMERHTLDDEQAFLVLSQVADTNHISVAEVADQLISSHTALHA